MKLLVSDYDGTFYTDEVNVKKNVNSIRYWMLYGNSFMISSGRSFNSIAKKLIEHNISVDYISTEDGSHLFDRNGNLLFEKNMDKSIINEIDDLKSLNNHDGIQYGTTYEYYDELPKYKEISSINFVIKKDKITPKFIKEWDSLKINNAYSFLVYSYDDISYFCIKPKGVDKRTPIEYLETSIPILKRNIYTVGDEDNDKTMVKSYNGYTIGDSTIKNDALASYNNIEEIINDIYTKKIKKRFR